LLISVEPSEATLDISGHLEPTPFLFAFPPSLSLPEVALDLPRRLAAVADPHTGILNLDLHLLLPRFKSITTYATRSPTTLHRPHSHHLVFSVAKMALGAMME
jgi:hypothetical protein